MYIFQGYPHCKLLIIANDKNIPAAVGGILGLSSIVVVTPDSISMISEAVASKKYVLTFQSADLDRRHRDFLGYFGKKKYIYQLKTQDLSKTIEYINANRPQVYSSDDRRVIMEGIKKIL